MNAHEAEARRPINEQWNPVKCKIINEIEKSGLSVIKKIIQEDISEDQAYSLEKNIIDKHGKIKNGGILTNIVDGGAGGKPKGRNKPIDQYTLTGELIITFASTRDAAYQLNIQPSQINGVIKGRAKQAGGFIWTYHGDIPSSYIKCKQVCQKDKQGNVIRIWNSVKECCQQLGLHQSSVRECISGKHKTAGGFVWNYID
jgi:hypothetical protein